MKLEKLLIYGGILYLVYELFLKNVPQASPITNAIDEAIDMISGGDGSSTSNSLNPTHGFRYAGGSAMRQDQNGNPIPCGVSGNPFTSAGVQGKSAQQGVAPTTFFATLELGSPDSIVNGYSEPYANVGGHTLKVGDRVQVSVLGGQFSALDNNVFTVLQLGTDTCTSSGNAQGKYSMVVIDLPIIIQGASDYQYPSMEAFGTLKQLN
jgi:hypothetical protein